MISLQNVTKTYGNSPAVNSISFSVAEGETLVLLGTSGCGKTTTLRMVNRLIEPTSGQILVNGKDVLLQVPDKLRRSIGYVLQHTGLFPHYTIAANIAVVPGLLGWQAKKVTNRTNELLQKLELDPGTIAHKYPNELSGGQQQRIGLARALAANPPVLLMDEPFGALDPITRAIIRRQFKQLDELKRKTILMVTHDVQEAFEMGNRVCIMNKGEIVQIGTPADLLFKPAHPFVAAFLKDHQFQLELQTTSVMHLSKWLPSNTKSSGSKDEAKSIWQMLELQSESSSVPPKANNQTTLAFTSAELLNAFQHYKNEMVNG